MAVNKRSPRDVDVHVGTRVLVAWHMRNMKQEDVARQLGVTFQQVQKYEKGSNRISASRLYQFATIMGVPILFFFEGVNDTGKIDPAVARATRFLSTRQSTLIADSFPGLGKQLQQAILGLVKAGRGR